MTSTLLPIDQNPKDSIQVGFSMQLTGTGNTYNDFSWTLAPDTINTINLGQSFN